MFLLTDRNGSFALFNQSPLSRYQGVFFWLDGRMYRSVAYIDLKKGFGDASFDGSAVLRKRDDVQESFCFADGVFLYELSEECFFDLVLDVKENYDNREWGRFYEHSVEKDVVVVRFSKRDDAHEHPGLEFDLFLAIAGVGSFSKIDEWEHHDYGYDEQRSSPPFKRWVYRLGTVSSDCVALSASFDRERAIRSAKDGLKNKSKLTEHDKVGSACDLAYSSLLSLQFDGGLFAGLPWFHQRWLRDELISVKALMLGGDFKLAKSIVFHWLDQINPDGSFPGTLSSKIADGSWVFVRLLDLLEMGNLTKAEQKKARDGLSVFLDRLGPFLVYNDAGQTWMDAVYDRDTREGARIEINALALAACKLAKKLGMPFEYHKDFEKLVRDSFWNGKYLQDGADDKTVRPNVFIAAYVYPELLSKQQWQKCFDYVLPKLWLKWGGLSTINKASKLFVDTHTGEDPRSYHRGDSWFWVNDLAAIVLNRFGKQKYARYIKKIVEASREEIMSMGAKGHHAEVSDAKALSSRGCLAQAWSDAMFVELCDELKLK